MSDKIRVEGVRVRVPFPLPPSVHNPLHRPPISYKKPLLALAIFTAVLIGALFVSWVAAVVWAVLFLCVISKRAVIWMIHLYQNKAPDKVRLRCVFEPSCSEYAILVIRRYGVIAGGIKTIGRLRRCHFPNGGPDYP